MLAATRIVPKAVEAFRTGDGIGWHEHDPDLFQGTERFFRPGYGANLVQSWIPALDGAEAKFRAGAKVADVGCGYGASTIIMAEAFPESQFWGFDYHEPSIRHGREMAANSGLSDRVTFEVALAKEYPGTDYDLVCHFDCLHDMGDPVGAAEHARGTLKADGHWLLVEPFANDNLTDNLNPCGDHWLLTAVRGHLGGTRPGVPAQEVWGLNACRGVRSDRISGSGCSRPDRFKLDQRPLGGLAAWLPPGPGKDNGRALGPSLARPCSLLRQADRPGQLRSGSRPGRTDGGRRFNGGAISAARDGSG